MAADVCCIINLDLFDVSVGFIAPSEESGQSFAITIKQKQVKTGGDVIIVYNDNMDGIPERIDGLGDELSELDGILFYHAVLKDIIKHISIQPLSPKELGAI